MQWVQERALQVKLAYPFEPSMHPNSPDPTHIPIEEVNELKETILRLEREYEELQLNLNRVTHERNKLKFNLDQGEKQTQ